MAKLPVKVEKISKSKVVEAHQTVVDVENVDLAFLERFVFPYISGVLEHLVRDGFSRIVCKNDQTVVLSNTKGKTLDLR